MSRLHFLLPIIALAFGATLLAPGFASGASQHERYAKQFAPIYEHPSRHAKHHAAKREQRKNHLSKSVKKTHSKVERRVAPRARGKAVKKKVRQPVPKTLITGDDAVDAAYTAYTRHDLAAFSRLDASGNVLEPYVAYWKLLTRIHTAQAIAPVEKYLKVFLRKWKDTPLPAQALAAWQKELANRDEWSLYLKRDPLPKPDLTLRCDSIAARYHLGKAFSADSLKNIYATVATPPEACQDLFTSLRAAGDISPELTRERIQLLLQRGQFARAKLLWKRLPDSQRAKPNWMTFAYREPFRYLGSALGPDETGSKDLLFFALEIAAQRDAERAHDLWQTAKTAWPIDTQLKGDIRVAYRAALQLSPQALNYFNALPQNVALSVPQREAYIRAALGSGKFFIALDQIKSLPDEEQNSDEWRYWTARCLETESTPEAKNKAHEIYSELAKTVDYYGALSMERLGIETVPLSDRLPVFDAAKVSAFEQLPAVQRMIALRAAGRRGLFMREWRALLAKLSGDDYLIAAEAMKEEGIFDRSIAAVEQIPFLSAGDETPAASTTTAAAASPSKTAAPSSILPAAQAARPQEDPPQQSVNDLDLRFPEPFESEFSRAATLYGVDENFLYAIARQESRFVPHIFSGAGARGLMQLMPGTARWAARQLSLRRFHVSQLKDPEINISLGAFYLKYCLEAFGQSVALTAAAYNAGPLRAKRWQQMLPMDGDIWVEQIPFSETRDYVKKVLLNDKLYSQKNHKNFSILAALKLPLPDADDSGQIESMP